MSLHKAEIAMGGANWYRRQWNLTNELSKDKKVSDRVMMYYWAPKPEQYGYGSSTVKARRDEFFSNSEKHYDKLTRNFIWC
jgi:hypothetical protein